jgi:hypothetical protein
MCRRIRRTVPTVKWCAEHREYLRCTAELLSRGIEMLRTSVFQISMNVLAGSGDRVINMTAATRLIFSDVLTAPQSLINVYRSQTDLYQDSDTSQGQREWVSVVMPITFGSEFILTITMFIALFYHVWCYAFSLIVSVMNNLLATFGILWGRFKSRSWRSVRSDKRQYCGSWPVSPIFLCKRGMNIFAVRLVYGKKV